MNFNKITIGIVTFKSEKVIFNCLKSIKKIRNIVIFDNSDDHNLKKKINKIYPKIKVILSKKNLGYGVGNNSIIKICKTPYLFVLSPDTILKKDCEKELLKAIKEKKNNFSIIAPLAKENNFGYFNNVKLNQKKLFEVDFVKGFAMLLNIKKIKKVGMFDKNFFLYLEEIDLCRRLKDNGQKIYISSKAKIKHLGAKSSDIGLNYDKIRNWHWMWSCVYYDKKFNNIFYVYQKYFLKLLVNLLKIVFYLIFFNNQKLQTYLFRTSGIFNSLIGRKSWFRPSLKKN